jgi:hypothetical protein
MSLWQKPLRRVRALPNLCDYLPARVISEHVAKVISHANHPIHQAAQQQLIVPPRYMIQMFTQSPNGRSLNDEISNREISNGERPTAHMQTVLDFMRQLYQTCKL